MKAHENKTVLRPYQRRWVNDPAQFAIAVKAAQIGYSTATGAWAVHRCLERPRHLVILLSRGERQSLELAEKAKAWVDGYQGVIAEFFPNERVRLGEAEVLQHEIRFPNQSRILALAANPDTARGYTGDIVLDEFAFHHDSEAIFQAAFRQTTLGYAMRILSTPNGQQGKFHDLAKQLGLASGIRPPRQPVGGGGPAGGWSGHWCDIHLAVEEGFPVIPERIRNAAGDEQTWLQEYCCQFVSQASQWFPAELYDRSASVEASVQLGPLPRGPRLAGMFHRGSDGARVPDGELYGGWDIARKRDLSVIWIAERVGDVTWTRGVIEMRNTPTPDQIREARALVPFLRKLNIDQSGMGLAIFEQLAREFPGRVEGVQFTAPVKEQLAVLGKRRAEEGKVRLPENHDVKNSFTAMKKSVNAVGQARFDAEHDDRYGHGDHFWAYCLAEAAAEPPDARAAEPPNQHLAAGAIFGTMRAPQLRPMERVAVF